MCKLRTCCACTCKDYVCKHSQPKWHCHFGSRAFVHASEKIWKFFFLPPRFVLPPCLVHQWALIASFLRRLRVRCLWRHQPLWLREAWTPFNMWKPSWRMTMSLQGLWTPKIGKWWQRWWKTRTMLRPTSCRVSMSSILRVQLPTCRTPLTRWWQLWRRWSWGRLPMVLKPPPGRRVWLPLRRSPLLMRHLWMTRSWSRPHTSGRSLAGAPHPLPSSWQRSFLHGGCDQGHQADGGQAEHWGDLWLVRQVLRLGEHPSRELGRVVKAYVAMKAQKVHDEVMKQPHVAGRSRPGVGSDSLRENTQPEPIATHQCPECFTDWATQWDPTKEKMCVCGIKKTKHLVNMDHPTGNWLLFMTGNGITWVRDGKSEADAASASGDGSSKSDKDFKLRHAVDIGMLAEAPLCPADHAETSLSDFVLSKDRLQLRTEVLHRVVDAETSPSEAPSRPQNSKDCKKDQAALVFHPDAAAAILAGKLTGADVPPEEAFHPKRPEAEMLKVVQDNADILHDMQSGAMSVEDPQGAEALRHLDMVLLKRKFLEGPGSNQSAWEALNRSMVDLDTAKTKNREYEQARRAYKQFLTPIAGNPSIWGEELQQLIEAGFFCPLTGMRKPSPELDQSNALGSMSRRSKWLQSFDSRPSLPSFEPGSPEAKVALLHHMINMCDGEIRLHTGRWRRYESTDVPTWSKLPQPVWEAAQALERRTHPKDQGSNFVEFHMYTDEELEDHRRLGLRPYWSYLKQLFRLWTCACRWRCWDLLGEGSPDLDPAYIAGDLCPSVFPEAALVCLGKLTCCREETQPGTTWWWSTRSSRSHCGEEEDPEGDYGFPGTDAAAEANLGGGVAFDLEGSWHPAGSKALY